MAAKQLQFDEGARHALLRGMEKLSKAVKATLGPAGRNVILDKKYGSPTITKDGVTVAKEIELEDPYENMGAQLARVEDALHATRAAVEEGIVAGGGVAYLRTQKALDNLKLEGDEAVGVQIVRRALEFPTRQLADNAGQEGAVIVQEVKNRSGNEGFNVATGEYEDLVKAGVVDPTKVTRTALQNAASISALLLTTEALVTELPEKEKPASGGPGGMDY